VTRVVDLTWGISESLPVLIAEINFMKDSDYRDEGFMTHLIQLHTHHGTHVDAPRHTVPGGRSVDEIDLGALYGEAVVLNLTEYGQPDAEIGLTEIREAEANLETGVRTGDFVILRTDWGRRTFGTADYWSRSPYLTGQAAEYLVQEKRVRGLGYDFQQEQSRSDHAELNIEVAEAGTPAGGNQSVGISQRESPLEGPVHRAVLGSDLYQVECMANVHQLQGERFKIMVAPLPLKGLDGSPARVLAFEEDWPSG
jgi:arylformamidase